MESKIKHLEFIQAVINRMAGNSFSLKGWSVTLVVGIFALDNIDTTWLLCFIVNIPIIVFWFLDSYYLSQEKMYRCLYDKIRLLPGEKIDFTMNASIDGLPEKKCFFFRCFISKTEILFYGSLDILSLLFVLIAKKP